MEGESEVEAGMPVVSTPEPEGDIGIAVLPAGRYVTVTHVGHPDRLPGIITALREWAAAGEPGVGHDGGRRC